MVSAASNLESQVKCYCRTFPNEFERAKGSKLFAKDGREYIDFFSGAGVMNYGHNNPLVQDALIAYLKADGIVHSLDMVTV